MKADFHILCELPKEVNTVDKRQTNQNRRWQ